MSSDNKPEIVLDANISPFRQKLREAASALSSFGDDGARSVEKLTGPLEMLRTKFIMIGAFLAGGKVFKEAISALKDQASSVMELSKSLGITSVEANILATALGNVFLDKETYVSTIHSVTRALGSNGEAFDRLGIKTKDNSGRLLPMQEIIANTVASLNTFTAGADRNVMAQQLLGKSYEDVLASSKLTAEALGEARDEVAQFHKEIDPDVVKAYKMSLENFGDGVEGVTLAIGRGAMPVFTELADWLSNAGPAATGMTIVVMDTLLNIYGVLRDVCVDVWTAISDTTRKAADIVGDALGVKIPSFGEIFVNVFRLANLTVLSFLHIFERSFEGIRGVISVTSEYLKRFSNVAQAAFNLDWVGVKTSWEEGGRAVEKALSESSDRIVAMEEKYSRKMTDALIGDLTSHAGSDKSPTGGNRASFSLDTGKSGGAKEKDQGLMQYYEAALAEEKRLASEEDALREYTKAEELAFWRTISEYAQLSAKDRLAVEKKVSDLVVAVRRQEAKEQQDLDRAGADHAAAMAQLRIDAAVAAADASLQAGRMDALERSRLDVEFENQRMNAQRDALTERLRMIERDPNTSPVERARILHQIEQLEAQHGVKMQQLQSKVAIESNRTWSTFTDRMMSLWDKGIQSLMNGTFTWRNAFRAIGAEMVRWFAVDIVGGMVKKWLAGKLEQIAISLGFMQAEKVAQSAGSDLIVAKKATEATAVATANAVEAGTGAAASQAPIPIVGPVLALAAMAAVFAAVSGLGGKIKSASKGYAIPRGLNPMMQLHEEETVLPREESATVRSLRDLPQMLAATQAALQGGAQGAPIHLHGSDAQVVKMSAIKKMLRTMHRDFVSVK